MLLPSQAESRQEPLEKGALVLKAGQPHNLFDLLSMWPGARSGQSFADWLIENGFAVRVAWEDVDEA